MRRFFQANRAEDYSQIQYLTAKCTRLAQEKALLDRLNLVSRERERDLHNHLEALTARLLDNEQINRKLRTKHDQLISILKEQQDMVDFLQQRVVMLAEESSREAGLLQQVGSELLSLQNSEVQLGGLVEELHAEAHRRAAVTVSLQAQLHRDTMELEELQHTNNSLAEELKELRCTHQREVGELQQENERSLRKLQETAEQFEWLCQQQRAWMCCVKRFKVRLMEERETLLRQVNVLEKKVNTLKENSHDQHTQSPLEETECCDRGSRTSGDSDAVADLKSEVDKSNTVYQELCNQAGSIIRRKKPP
ncbi:uncharacterized protein LOC142999552 [Genypterus blacodes]|uniref:uncharacterized protein LOC142999552 n=1 Tax=Genypterus blacodes TaxID=154954 RepID=UPI003F75BEFD